MRTPSPSKCRLDLVPPLADRFIVGVAPIDYGPVLLLMPFGFHLTMDTLPSGELQAGGFRSALNCFRLSLSCPFRLLHTFHLLRPARHYPRVRIWRSSFERQRDFNPPEQRAAQRALWASPTPGQGRSLSYAFPRAVGVGCPSPPCRVSQVSSTVLSLRAVPTHPGRSDGCLLIASPPITGFINCGRLATFTGVTRPNRVRLRYGSQVCVAGFHQTDCSVPLRFRYMYE